MTKVNEKGIRSTDIRKAAEEVLKGKTTDMKKLSSGDAQSLVHELQVHQIELEIQNEELRKAQKELEEAHNQYSDLYNFAPIGYFTFDKNGLILQVNLTGAKKLERERAYLIKKPFSLYISPDHKDAFYSHLRQVFDTETQTTCELRLVDKMGHQFDALLESMHVRDSEGNRLVRTAMSDITQRKQAEELRLKMESLLLAKKANSEFMSRVSHELITPLNAIMGYSEILKEEIKGTSNDVQESADNILASSRHLLDLINDILDLSRAERGTLELVIENTSVPEIIGDTVSIIKDIASKKNVIIKQELDKELEYIEADKKRLKQILINLYANAVKYNKAEGGIVTIRTRKNGNMAEFSISDTGIGIKDEDLNKLFITFNQLDSKLSKKYQGAGIGLAFTKYLVELHDGKIWAESKFGEGSTFTFTLPLADKNKG